MSHHIIEAKNLQYNYPDGTRGIKDVSFRITHGESVAIVGANGAGKSTLLLHLNGYLLPTSGTLRIGDYPVSKRNLKAVRRTVGMVFQDFALFPHLRVEDNVRFGLQRLERHEQQARVQEMLAIVGMLAYAQAYPHQLSGGMRQRVMIAMALACKPKVLIADEPTTALDVTIQAQILDLMNQLQADLGASILLITHDLGVIAETADRVAVMYAGRIVEEADVKTIFKNPVHYYTQGLLDSIPRIDEEQRPQRLSEIPGRVPNLCFLPPGCAFYDRCPVGIDQCRAERPKLQSVDEGHLVSCWKA